MRVVTAPALTSGARRAVRLEQATIAYNVVEGVIAVGAGLAAGLVSLIGFGIDSGIEVAAATVVLARLTADLRGGEVDQVKERGALRFIAITFFALAAYVTVEGIRGLVGGEEPDTSRTRPRRSCAPGCPSRRSPGCSPTPSQAGPGSTPSPGSSSRGSRLWKDAKPGRARSRAPTTATDAPAHT